MNIPDPLLHPLFSSFIFCQNIFVRKRLKATPKRDIKKVRSDLTHSFRIEAHIDIGVARGSAMAIKSLEGKKPIMKQHEIRVTTLRKNFYSGRIFFLHFAGLLAKMRE